MTAVTQAEVDAGSRAIHEAECSWDACIVMNHAGHQSDFNDDMARAVLEAAAAVRQHHTLRDREALGKLVRDAWVRAVLELIPDPKPSWTEPWETLADEFQREADRRIGAELHGLGFNDGAEAERARMADMLPGRLIEALTLLEVRVPQSGLMAGKILAQDFAAALIKAMGPL